MFDIRHETPLDIAAREALLDRCFGEDRFRKTCERLREGRLPASGLSLVVDRDGAVAATVRLWHVTAGPGRPALLLGPIAVDPELQGVGIGTKLMGEALSCAVTLGHRAVLLVGDAPYYGRFGFTAHAVDGLWLPGPYERGRFLGLALTPAALDGAHGLVSPTGRRRPLPDFRSLLKVASDEMPAIGRAA